MKCSKCSGKMEEGVVADASYATVTEGSWAKSVGMKFAGIGVKDRKPFKAIRCVNCGYIELYAK